MSHPTGLLHKKPLFLFCNDTVVISNELVWTRELSLDFNIIMMSHPLKTFSKVSSFFFVSLSTLSTCVWKPSSPLSKMSIFGTLYLWKDRVHSSLTVITAWNCYETRQVEPTLPRIGKDNNKKLCSNAPHHPYLSANAGPPFILTGIGGKPRKQNQHH